MTEKCTRCCVVECYDEGDNSVPVVDVRVANDVDSWFNDDDWVCVNSHVDYSLPVDPFLMMIGMLMTMFS